MNVRSEKLVELISWKRFFFTLSLSPEKTFIEIVFKISKFKETRNSLFKKCQKNVLFIALDKYRIKIYVRHDKVLNDKMFRFCFVEIQSNARNVSRKVLARS